MNRTPKKIIATCFLAIYGLVAALLCSYGYDLYSQKTDLQQNSAQEFYSVITGSQAGGALQPKKQATLSIDTGYTDNSNSIAQFSALLHSNEDFCSCLFTRYSSSSANMPSRVSKTLIIFPFNYFW